MTIRYHFELRETIATILADNEEVIQAASMGMRTARSELERYLVRDPFFGTSYEPVQVPDHPIIARRMAQAAEKAGVGPMAAVAGAVAEHGVAAAQKSGASFCVIDNGGDIALITDRPVRIGIYAGESPLSGKYAFVIRPTDEIYGICTSSATVGHSFSFGTADSVTVFSSDPILADAVATAVCNVLTISDKSCLDELDTEIDGVYATFNDTSIIWGEVPSLVRAEKRDDLITAGGLGFFTRES